MIVYHGTPTGLNKFYEASVFRARHIMVSYATQARNVAWYSSLAASVVLDNGAFSKWKTGEELDIDGFYKWAEVSVEHPNVLWFCVPDKIGGTEEENDALLKTIPVHLKRHAWPVWHLHESIERLVHLSELFGRVCLGSSGEYHRPATETWWNRMNEAYPRIPKRTKIHGLRMANPRITSKLPMTSVDSTTAGRNSNLGSQFKGPLSGCKSATRVLAYAEYLEGALNPYDPVLAREEK